MFRRKKKTTVKAKSQEGPPLDMSALYANIFLFYKIGVSLKMKLNYIRYTYEECFKKYSFYLKVFSHLIAILLDSVTDYIS